MVEETARYDGREREWGQLEEANYNKEWKTSDEAESYQTGSSEVLESSKTLTQTYDTYLVRHPARALS